MEWRPDQADSRKGQQLPIKALLREHPGATRVVVHLPGGPGRAALPMELRNRVAYDSELLAEVRRRLRDGLVSLELGA